MRQFLADEYGLHDVRLLCPLADAPEPLTTQIETACSEEAIRRECRKARRIIADPIYARLLPGEEKKFLSFPHEAYSGRHYRDDLPLFVGPDARKWLDEKGF